VSRQTQQREPRYISHALVEVRRYRYLPIWVESAVLLDLSVHGYKLEFTSEVVIKPGKKLWLYIPLRLLGVHVSKHFLAEIYCRWFDVNRFRIGGEFVDTSKKNKQILAKVVDALKHKDIKISK